MRILIIEDSDTIRHMIEVLVSARGHQVDVASTGSKGLEVAFEKLPDAILLDLMLKGGFDGFEVCARVRANPLTRSTPVIVISALADQGSKQRAINAGCNAYYTKPFSPTALLKELESLRTRQLSVPNLE